MNGERIINVQGLRYNYPDGTEALRGIDFHLCAGETVALLGPNGSGKTTFVMHLNGLFVGEGSVTVCGEALSPKPTKAALARVRAKVGLVFQDADEQLFMPTVLEDAAFGPAQTGATLADAEALARRALEKTRMTHALAKAPYHLSAGEKRRVALAGVLAMDPEVLVLDEPTTSLDPPGQRELIELLRSLPQAKILVTHDVSFAAALASRAVFFENGQMAGEGTVAEVVARFGW